MLTRRYRHKPLLTRPDADHVCTQFLYWLTCTAPTVVAALASGEVVSEGGTIEQIRVQCQTLPANSGDSFGFNVHVDGAPVFSASQVFDRDPLVGGFATTADAVTFTDLLDEVTGAGFADLSLLDTSDYVYAGFREIWAGLELTLAAVNDQDAVLSAEYRTASGWQAQALTDGTASAGKTLAQSGAVTWTPQADWVATNEGQLGELYWMRLKTSALLGATVEVDTARAIRDTGHFYLFTPDQNLVIPDGGELRVAATEADANAAGLTVMVVGVH